MRSMKVGIAIAVGGAATMLGLLGCHGVPSSGGGSTTASDAATPLAVDAAQAGPVNELPIPKEKVDSTVNPEHLPAYHGPTGVVEGTVWVTGAEAPPLMGKSFDKCPAAAEVYSKTFREGPADAQGRRPLADAIVGVTGYSGFYVPEQKTSKLLTIANCAYSARTVDMTFGQALEVKNDNAGPLFAPTFENQADPVLMVAAPNSDPVRLYPRAPGRYRLIDRAGHSWLEADVYVLFQPLHAVTDLAGHFRIEGVPVGKLKIGVQHPAIDKQVQQDIDVKDGVVSEVELSVPNVKPAPRPPSRNLKPIIP